jgi:uncharacterized protein with HEPN domain
MHLGDILQSIDHINDFLGGMAFENYMQDLKTRSAVERQLQIITEAAIRLGGEAEVLCPSLDWRGYRGMGTSSGTNTIESTIRSSGTRSNWSCRSCEQPS